LATAPISVNDLAPPAAESSSPWTAATHNLAAVEIWEMVDGLVESEPPDDDLLSVGTADDAKPARASWLRGRKA
jgi:hypothetical protein